MKKLFNWKYHKKFVVSLVAFIFVVEMIVGNLTSLTKAGEENDAPVYSYAYTIENFLSGYNFFIYNNITDNNDTIGNAACGGIMDFSGGYSTPISKVTYGNVASYAGTYKNVHLASANITGVSDVDSSIRTLYYNKVADDAVEIPSSDSSCVYKQIENKYIDFDSAFSNIASESNGYTTASGVYTVSEKDVIDSNGVYSLIIDLSKANHINVPYALYKEYSQGA